MLSEHKKQVTLSGQILLKWTHKLIILKENKSKVKIKQRDDIKFGNVDQKFYLDHENKKNAGFVSNNLF